MNNRALKGAFIATVFSIFSGFAMMTEREQMDSPISHIKVENKTSSPIFFNLGEVYQNRPIEAGGIRKFSSDFWTDNPDKYILGYTLSRAQPTSTYDILKNFFGYKVAAKAEDHPLASVKILKTKPDLQVIFTIGSSSMAYDFDITGAKLLSFITTIADDSSKPAGNFEASTFELEKDGVNIILPLKVVSLEEQAKQAEEQAKRALAQERFGIEQKRLLERPEFKDILRGQNPAALFPMLPRK
jgi:hypothetical protein